MLDEKALNFLKDMKGFLRDHIEAHAEVTRRCAEGRVIGGRKSTSLTLREGAFLDKFILPNLFAFLKEKLGDESRARDSR